MSTGLDDTPPAPSASGLHEVVHDTLSALDAAGVVLALLRGGDEPASGGDVDVLVAESDLATTESHLRAAGWLQAPAAGHGSHRFHIRYHAATRTWHELDLVTHIDLGSLQGYRTGLAPDCLARRVHRDGLPVLDPDDAFWLLFAQQGWKPSTPYRQRRLVQAARRASARGPVADLVAGLLPGGAADLEPVLAAARDGDAGAVTALQRRLRARWRRADGGRIAVRQAVNWVLQRAVVAEDRGLSLALLGLDGAGKTTVVARLRDEVPWPTVSLYMGVWRESALDRLVRPFLGAQLLLRLGRLSRNALVTRYHRALGRIVLLDRYVVDATLPSPELDWKGRLSAVLVLRTAPAPDRMVFLDAPAEVVFARKGEIGVEELEQRRAHYRELQSRFPQWVTVDCDRPLEQVLADVHGIVWDELVRTRSAADS
jgi:thymidylate kinase